MLNRIMKDESGVLTFEWILLITLLVIGIVGGIAVIRDALIIEAGETAGAIVALDHSYVIADPLEAKILQGVTEWQVTFDENNQAVITPLNGASNISGDAEGSSYMDKETVVTVSAESKSSTSLDKVTEELKKN
ncbi:MAG: hypothetical protein Q4C70_05615 [Planctomycetia bacterium]|nr:hypothetical protein [Planctomycetia bacterium]